MGTDLDTPSPRWSDDPADDGLIRIELPPTEHGVANARQRVLDLISPDATPDDGPSRGSREQDTHAPRFAAGS
jgi:hypothetical protein